MRTSAVQVVASGYRLAEGPIWSEAESALYWVDIGEPQLLRLDARSGTVVARRLPSRPGCVVERNGGGLLLALQDGFATYDWDGAKLAHVVDPEPHLPGNRFNDGGCDTRGRLFAGTMDDTEQAATGTLYRLDPDRSCTPAVTGLMISNGIGWSLDDRTVYHVDSGPGTVTAYAYDIGTGGIGAPRWSYRLEAGDGLPDGLAVDVRGRLWVAVWDGHRIEIVEPDGTLGGVVELPAARPTSCAFGGRDLRTLYVTTAGISADASADGSVLALEVDTSGLPHNRYAG